MCSLRDAATELGEMGVRIYGASRDGVADLAAFHEKETLGFPLLSDPDGSLSGKYDVDFEGRPFARRVTFVLDSKGVVRERDEEVRVDQHGRDLVERIARLQEGD